MCVKKKVCKAQEWGGMYQTYKHINLNKIRRSNKRVAEDRVSREEYKRFIMWYSKQKVRKFVAFFTGV